MFPTDMAFLSPSLHNTVRDPDESISPWTKTISEEKKINYLIISYSLKGLTISPT